MQNPRQVQAQGETVDLGAETGTLYNCKAVKISLNSFYAF